MIYVQLSAFLVFFLWGLNMTNWYPQFAAALFALAFLWLLPIIIKFVRHYVMSFARSGANLRDLTVEDVDDAAKQLRQLAEVSTQVLTPKFHNITFFKYSGLNFAAGRGQVITSQEKLILYIHSFSNLTFTGSRTDEVLWADVVDFEVSGWLTTSQGRRWRLASKTKPEMLVIFAVIQTLLTAARTSPDGKVDLTKTGISETLESAADVLQAAKSRMVQNRDFALDFSVALQTHNKEERARRPTLGREVNGYTLVQKLGKGGFGEVFLGVKEVDGVENKAAIKIMNADDSLSKEMTKKKSDFFMREAKLNLSIQGNAYVLGALSFGSSPRPWIMYPFVEGYTLQKRLAAKKKLSEAEWWNLAYDLVAAVAHLESEGVIHRDIKPDNIMLTNDRAVLLDLGISTLQEHTFTDGRGGGTEGWMAPEVVSKAPKDLTSASDIFAIGMTLYAAKTLRMPFAVPKDLRNWPAVVARSELNLSGFDYPEAALLSNMLLPLPEDRATTAELLEMISKHVDLDQKKLLEASHQSETFITDEDVYQAGFDYSFKKEAFIEGPFDGWSSLNNSIQDLVLANKAKMFSVQIVIENTGVLYFQAMVQHGGWVIEVMHQYWKGPETGPTFSQAMAKRDWNPPTTSAPNFHRYIGERNPGRDLPKAMIEVLEMVHELRLSQVAAFAISVHGKNFVVKSSKK